MSTLRHALAAIAIAAASSSALATVSMPAVFSDGMVIQRGEAAFFGFARPGEKIVIEGSWGGRVETIGDAQGRFMAMLPTGEAGGPFGVKVAGDNELTFRDVLVGEVWLASGQSNMEQKIAPPSYDGVENWRAEVATADFPSIRFFDVRNAIAATPRSNVNGSWVAVSPKTAGSLSAVAFFFARDVHQALDVPVGVITSDWGGTRIEAWMSPESLAAFPEYAGDLEYLALVADPARRSQATAGLEEQWWNDLDAKAPGGNAWKTAGYDASGWSSMDLPSTLSGEYGGFDGMLFFRRTIELPADWDSEAAATLELGPIDDEDDAFVNGVLVGSTHGDGKWRSAALRDPAGHAEARAERDRGADGRQLGARRHQRRRGADEDRLGRSLGAACGRLEGREGARPQRVPAAATVGACANTVTALHQAMIHPIKAFTVAGYLWYQGESNRGNAARYADLLAAMAEDSRDGDATRPFLIVQIAPFKYGGDQGETAWLREAQCAAAATIPNAGLAVTMDCGDPLDIHPARKQPVGQRLALLALEQAYEQPVVSSGPEFIEAVREGDGLRIRFEHAEGLFARNNEVRQIAVAGADRVWHRALAVIDGEEVVAIAPEVPEPVAVRYLWCPACEAELFNGDGIPAAPFRSDDWDGPFGGVANPIRNEGEMERLRTREDGFVDLFDGVSLDGWQIVNGAPSTWTVADGVIECSGFPTGVMRTDRTYENFILELEYRHLVPGGNAGLFVWSDPITARGQPFTRSVEVQVMDGQEQGWFTSDGDVFPIHGARMTPVDGRGGDRAYPSERRSNPAPMWNHYRVECVDGRIVVALNGKVVTEGYDIAPRRGFICLESEGSPVEFRAIRLKELPAADPPIPASLVADEDARPWICLYNGVDLSGWRQDPANAGHWKVQDWILSYDGKGTDLWTEREFGDFEMICDWKFPGVPKPTRRPVIARGGSQATAPDGTLLEVEVPDAGDSGIYLRGSSKSQVNIWCWPVGSGEVYGYRTDGSMPPEVRAGVTPSEPADRPLGEWNRFHIVMKGDRLTVTLNGKTVIENAQLPGVAERGPIALQHHGDPIQFANIFVRDLE